MRRAWEGDVGKVNCRADKDFTVSVTLYRPGVAMSS